MERIAEILSTLDYSLNTRKKRHIAGGVLLSISFFFGGLAFTIMTLKTEDNDEDLYLE